MSAYRLRYIGANIVFQRLLQNMDQSELADAANISQGMLSKIERGKLNSISLITLYSIADALNIELTILIREPENPSS